MNRVFLAVVAVAVMGAGCAQTARVNTNAAVNMEESGSAENANMPQETNTNMQAAGNVNVNAEVDDILRETTDEQESEVTGDESDLTTAETLDLNAMIGASGNY